MVVPPIRIPAPTGGGFAPISIGPPQGVIEPPNPSQPGPGTGSLDPNTIEGRIGLRNQIRESLMSDEIRALLTKQSTNQTLTSEELRRLAEWEDRVEVAYSARVGTGIPPDVQARIEKLAADAEAIRTRQSGGGGGGGGGSRAGGGGGARGGGGAATGGGARPPAGAGGAARPTALPKGAQQPAKPQQQPTTATTTAEGPRRTLLEAVADRMADPSGRTHPIADPAAVNILRQSVADYLRAYPQTNGQLRPDHPHDADAAEAVKEIAVRGWFSQYIRNGGQGLDVGQVNAMKQAGLIAPDGTPIKAGPQQATALVKAMTDDPNYPMNTYARAWIGMTVADQESPLGKDLRGEVGLGPATARSTAAAPVTGAPLDPTRFQQPPTDAALANMTTPPADLDPGSLFMHPMRPNEPAWVEPNGHAIAIGADGTRTDLGVHPEFWAVAQRNNQAYYNQGGRGQQGQAQSAPLSDQQLAGESGDTAVRLAWQAQKNKDEQTGQNTLGEANQVGPSAQFAADFKRWYTQRRDLGESPSPNEYANRTATPLEQAPGQATPENPVPAAPTVPVPDLSPPAEAEQTGAEPIAIPNPVHWQDTLGEDQPTFARAQDRNGSDRGDSDLGWGPNANGPQDLTNAWMNNLPGGDQGEGGGNEFNVPNLGEVGGPPDESGGGAPPDEGSGGGNEPSDGGDEPSDGNDEPSDGGDEPKDDEPKDKKPKDEGDEENNDEEDQ